MIRARREMPGIEGTLLPGTQSKHRLVLLETVSMKRDSVKFR